MPKSLQRRWKRMDRWHQHRKINAEKKEMLEKQKLLNKARLWMVLHGITPKNYIKKHFIDNYRLCELAKCPNFKKLGFYCSRLRIKRLTIVNAESQKLIEVVDPEIPLGESSVPNYCYCIEWAKYV